MAACMIKEKKDLEAILTKITIPDFRFEFVGEEPYGKHYDLPGGFTPVDVHGFVSAIRCAFNPDASETFDYKQAFKEFISQFSDLTTTRWITKPSGSKALGVKVVYSARYCCHLSSVNKKDADKHNVDPRTGCMKRGIRNLQCPAEIKLTAKKITQFSFRRDQDGYYLDRDRPLNVELIIKFDHNHDFYSQNIPSTVRVPHCTKRQLNELIGMPDIPVKTKEELKSILEKFSEPFEFVGEGPGQKYTAEDGFHKVDPHGFHARIRCTLTPENNSQTFDYAKAFKDWIEKFSSLTATKWIVNNGSSKPTGKTRIASARFACHLAALNKRKVEQRKKDCRTGSFRKGNSFRNFGCAASVSFSVTKIGPSALRSDRDSHYLNRPRPLDTDIKIIFNHSHPLRGQHIWRPTEVADTGVKKQHAACKRRVQLCNRKIHLFKKRSNFEAFVNKIRERNKEYSDVEMVETDRIAEGVAVEGKDNKGRLSSSAEAVVGGNRNEMMKRNMLSADATSDECHSAIAKEEEEPVEEDMSTFESHEAMDYPIREKAHLESFLRQIDSNFEFVAAEPFGERCTLAGGFQRLENGFRAIIRWSFPKNSLQGSKAAFRQWMDKFSNFTGTSWIITTGAWKSSRCTQVMEAEWFRCHLSSHMKHINDKRNLHCPAQIKFTVQEISYFSKRRTRDGYLYMGTKRPLNVLIDINFQHNHDRSGVLRALSSNVPSNSCTMDNLFKRRRLNNNRSTGEHVEDHVYTKSPTTFLQREKPTVATNEECCSAIVKEELPNEEDNGHTNASIFQLQPDTCGIVPITSDGAVKIEVDLDADVPCSSNSCTPTPSPPSQTGTKRKTSHIGVECNRISEVKQEADWVTVNVNVPQVKTEQEADWVTVNESVPQMKTQPSDQPTVTVTPDKQKQLKRQEKSDPETDTKRTASGIAPVVVWDRYRRTCMLADVKQKANVDVQRDKTEPNDTRTVAVSRDKQKQLKRATPKGQVSAQLISVKYISSTAAQQRRLNASVDKQPSEPSTSSVTEQLNPTGKLMLPVGATSDECLSAIAKEEPAGEEDIVTANCHLQPEACEIVPSSSIVKEEPADEEDTEYTNPPTFQPATSAAVPSTSDGAVKIEVDLDADVPCTSNSCTLNPAPPPQTGTKRKASCYMLTTPIDVECNSNDEVKQEADLGTGNVSVPQVKTEPNDEQAVTRGQDKHKRKYSKQEERVYLALAVAREMLMFPGTEFTLESFLQFEPVWLQKFPCSVNLQAVVDDLVSCGLLRSIGPVCVNEREYSHGYRKVDYDTIATHQQLQLAIKKCGCSLEGYKKSLETGPG